MARKNDAFYFDSFRKHAELSCQAAALLGEVMRSYNIEEFKSAVDKMHEIEQAADEIKHEMSLPASARTSRCSPRTSIP